MKAVKAWSGRQKILLSAGAAVVVAGLVWLGWPTEEPAPLAPVNNVAGNYRACLLSPIGIDVPPSASQVWTGLQEAAAGGRVNAQQFPVPGSGAATVAPYVNGVVGQGCDVVVAADQSLVPAVEAAAKRVTEQRFLLVGVSLDLPNVATVPTAGDVSGWVVQRAGGG
jgi:hypothetical protein